MARNTVNANIVLPISFVKEIDIAKGDVCRSRFVLRAVEKYLKDLNAINSKSLYQTEVMGATFQVTPITQDVACHRKTHRTSIGNGEGLYGCEHHGT